jgi:hypothetical protein
MPQGVFGAIFQSDPNIQVALGCPLAISASSVGSAYQPFQNGLMIWVSSLGAQPQSAIYALYNNGTYQRFNDTFQDGVDPASSGASPPPNFFGAGARVRQSVARTVLGTGYTRLGHDRRAAAQPSVDV